MDESEWGGDETDEQGEGEVESGKRGEEHAEEEERECFDEFVLLDCRGEVVCYGVRDYNRKNISDDNEDAEDGSEHLKKSLVILEFEVEFELTFCGVWLKM